MNSPTPSDATTGVSGHVFRGPTKPVCVDSCEETFAANFYLKYGDLTVLSFRTETDGAFQLKVEPGVYTVVPADDAPILHPKGQTWQIVVPEGTPATVRLDFDTGIR